MVYSSARGDMVLCVVFGCSKRSGLDKDVSFTGYLKSSLLKVKTSRNRVEIGALVFCPR